MNTSTRIIREDLLASLFSPCTRWLHLIYLSTNTFFLKVAKVLTVCPSLQVLPPPAGYVPIRTPARKLSATPTPMGGMTGFHMQVEDRTTKQMNDQPSGNLPFLKPDDIQYFDKLLVSTTYIYIYIYTRQSAVKSISWDVWSSDDDCGFCFRWRSMSPLWAPRSRKRGRSWSCCWRLKMEHRPWERFVAVVKKNVNV